MLDVSKIVDVDAPKVQEMMGREEESESSDYMGYNHYIDPEEASKSAEENDTSYYTDYNHYINLEEADKAAAEKEKETQSTSVLPDCLLADGEFYPPVSLVPDRDSRLSSQPLTDSYNNTGYVCVMQG